MIARVLRMNAFDHQVTITWIPEGKRRGKGGGERGAWRRVVKSPGDMMNDYMDNLLD